MKFLQETLFKASVLLFISVGWASACSVCFGAPESNMTEGMNKAILFMLGIVSFLLAGFGGFFFYLNKKIKAASNTEGQTHA